MKTPTRVPILIAVTALAIAGLGTVPVVAGNAAASRAAAAYHRQHLLLDGELRAAAARGYTISDLSPITTRLKAVDSAREPWWIPGRSGFYDHEAATVGQLRRDLRALEVKALSVAQTSAAQHIGSAGSAIDEDRRLAAADPDLEALQKRLNDVAIAQVSARTLSDFRAVDNQAQLVARDAGMLAVQLNQENAEIQSAAVALLAQTGPNLDAIHKAGSDALAAGRNEATVAAYMNKPRLFNNLAEVNRAYSRLEKFAGQVGSSDLNQAASAAAAVERFAGEIHSALVAGLPSKAILISYTGQELWAYQDGKLVQDTLVTTGRPALPTDVGPMKVLSKSSPWTMHSPWPPGSPAWYPDTVVQMVLWFTNTGEGLHDAYWQSCCWGPGSQYGPSASHGCIHVPFGNEQFLFRWADVGTPVIVYPGDGTPVSSQVNQISTDDQGNPLSGPGAPKGI